MDYLMNIGKSVKVALAQQEKGVKWLANEAEVSRQSAWLYTTKRNPGSDVIEKLAGIFGMKESEFIALGE